MGKEGNEARIQREIPFLLEALRKTEGACGRLGRGPGVTGVTGVTGQPCSSWAHRKATFILPHAGSSLQRRGSSSGDRVCHCYTRITEKYRNPNRSKHPYLP